MPVVSQAQNRYMRAHANDQGKLGTVAREFVSASHGMKVSKLPQHKRPAAKKPKRMPVFGSLVPQSAGHYLSTPTPTGDDEAP